jgi:heme a synthase
VTDFSASPPHPVGLHRLCWLIVGLVWPLIWVGGLVTTYDAGMSVPDWPGTYGYNLFLYPYKTWLFGPFDLFIEHGHRLLGAVVGFVAIGIVIAAWLGETRRWVRRLGIALLLMVIVQGSLGGFRVVLSDQVLAMIHGCFGPAFFALCAATVFITGETWFRPESSAASVNGRKLTLPLPLAMVLLAYSQLVFGAMLRHAPPTLSATGFGHIVLTHVVGAFLLWILTGVTFLKARRCGDLTLSRSAAWLVGLVGVQITLGISTWVVKYGWPTILAWVPTSDSTLLRSKGFIDSIIITGHVATGSLILALSAVLVARVLRIRWLDSEARSSRIPDTAVNL